MLSGARGESREQRSQLQNKETAFKRLCETPKFKSWLKIEIARRLSQDKETVEQKVERAMDPKNLRVEEITEEGWREIQHA